MVKRALLLAFLLSTTSTPFAQLEQQFDHEAITQLLHQHADDDSPGMAVGVIQNGEVRYEHYMGYANLEHEVKIDRNTRFNIASNCKQFTALCILKLVEAGKISLEDDFRTYLPDILKEVPEKITVGQLINHTSGVRDIHALWALQGKTWWEHFLDNGDAMDLLRGQRELNFKPGTEYLYSNSNYVLLTEIVKRVTDQKFSEFSKALFEDIGMPNTAFRTNYMAVIPYKARPYGNWGGWREYPSITEIHGDGALFSTLNDQLQWEKIVQLNDGSQLSQSLINQSQSLPENTIGNDYGFGLVFGNYSGVDYTFHNGETGAYHATFLRFPTKQLSIVVMSNCGSVPSNYLSWQIAKQVLDLKAEKPNYPRAPKKMEKLKQVQVISGNYQNDEGTVVRIIEKDGSMVALAYQQDPIRLIQEEEGLFHAEANPEMKANFINLGKANQEFMLYRPNRAPVRYGKLVGSDLTRFNKTELNGTFYNDETDTKVILAHRDGNTYSLVKNGREREAELIVEDYLRLMGSYKIKIIRDADGRVTGLNVDNDRIRNVIFERTE